MRFGYGLITCQRYPGDPRTDSDLYGEALELAAEAEDLGFDSVWTSEHHFADDAYMPAVFPVAAAIAARTERIEIGTGLALAPFYSPLRLAEDAATVDLISKGRFVLGLGMGWLEWEFEALGVPIGERVSRTVAAVETCRQAWGGGLVDASRVAVAPKPHREGGPPIWIGAAAEPAVRRAARMGDGWIAGEPSEEEFREQVGWLRDERARMRKSDPFEIAGYWPVFVWEDDTAWERVKPFLYYMEWKYADAEEAKGRLGAPPMPPPLDDEGAEGLRSYILCGTPDELAARIVAIAEIGGQDMTFIARLYYPGMPPAPMRRSAKLFAEEVVPLVAKS